MRSLLLACVMVLTGVFPALAEEANKRIVSVGGGVTEILYELGLGKQIVGSDTTSYYPPEANKHPKVGYQRALSAEGVLSLSPEIIVTTTDAGPPPVVKQIEAIGVKRINVKAAKDFNQTLANIETIANELGVGKKGQSLVEALKTDRKALQQRVEKAGSKPKIMFVMQHGGSPMMVAGTQTSAESVIQMAGGVNVVGEFEGFRPLTAESLVEKKPDYILTTDLGLKTVGGMAGILRLPGMDLTPAGRNKKIISMDTLLLLGFGPRTVDAAEELFEKIHN
ncbi:MAG: hemin ABC transporter substrate-binding protein [Sneathiellales bacterium]|nr:hemin ABC transporter substrate-binding protein [Sneathiellales bacterium]